MHEQQVLDALKKASNYERGFDQLDEVQKAVIKNLQEVADDLSKIAGKKQKCICSYNFHFWYNNDWYI
jgi:hypothetical protein